MTPASLFRPHARCDDLMEKVAAKLGVQIPEWRLQRQLKIKAERAEGKKSGTDDWRLEVIGVEPDGTPASIFNGVEVSALPPGSDMVDSSVSLSDQDTITKSRRATSSRTVRMPVHGADIIEESQCYGGHALYGTLQ